MRFGFSLGDLETRERRRVWKVLNHTPPFQGAGKARVDGRAGPFASTKPYAFPHAQRREGTPWGCATDACIRTREELGYDI